MGVTYLPFFEGGLERAAECVVGLVWLAWAEFSAFQLSDLKERCGLGELALCLTEKLTLSLSMAAGIALFRLVDLTPLLASREVLEVVVFGAACLLMLGAAYAVGCLVGERTEDQLRAELARSRREQVERVYDRLAGEYALSSREREVMGMLAGGGTPAPTSARRLASPMARLRRTSRTSTRSSTSTARMTCSPSSTPRSLEPSLPGPRAKARPIAHTMAI